MSKIFVLDTNILIHNPAAVYVFAEHDVVIPIMVVEELDRLKSYSDDRGRSARQSARVLDELLMKSEGTQNHGNSCQLPGGGILQIVLTPNIKMPLGLDPQKNDNQILLTALKISGENPDRETVFVSMDLNARIKARSVGLLTEDFLNDRVELEELYTGFRKIIVPEDSIDIFFKNKSLTPEEFPHINNSYPNEFFLLEGEVAGKGKTALGRFDGRKNCLVALKHHLDEPMGIIPLNTEQKFAMELLQDDKIQLVCLLGKAGTGKTLLAIAAGLRKTLNEKLYRKVSIARPVIPMGKDIGYLPGTKDEKLFHWMRPIFDNLEFLYTQNDETQEQAEKNIQALTDRGSLEIEALTYIRGRSLARDYFIVDEAQNLTPHEVKTIVSRAGKGTKVVLTGDIYQIDNPYLDASNNGLTYCVERFKFQEIFGSIILSRAERSTLSDLAGQLL